MLTSIFGTRLQSGIRKSPHKRMLSAATFSLSLRSVTATVFFIVFILLCHFIFVLSSLFWKFVLFFLNRFSMFKKISPNFALCAACFFHSIREFLAWTLYDTSCIHRIFHAVRTLSFYMDISHLSSFSSSDKFKIVSNPISIHPILHWQALPNNYPKWGNSLSRLTPTAPSERVTPSVSCADSSLSEGAYMPSSLRRVAFSKRKWRVELLQNRNLWLFRKINFIACTMRKQ